MDVKFVFKALFIVSFISNGLSRSARVKRVIGGGYAKPGQWPWIVSLQARIITRSFMGIPLARATMYCGGTLVTSQWILTAAHCFMPGYTIPRGVLYPGNWHARLGSVDLKADFRDRVMDTLGRLLNINAWIQVEQKLKKIAIYPYYSPSHNLKHDVALVKLSHPVAGHENIKPIAIPSQDATFPQPGNTCVAKGWGCLKSGGAVSQNMRHINLTVYDQARCQWLYQMDMSTRVCAGVTGSSICRGDSGGPLVCKMNGEWVHAGIASFTRVVSPENYPSVFTKTSTYTNWISHVVRNY